VDVLQKLLRQDGLQCSKLAAVFCKGSELRAIHIFLTKVHGSFRAMFHDLEGPSERVVSPAQAVIGISHLYARAIAKIGFHYVLRFCPHLTGREPEFERIVRYIGRGEGSWKDILVFPDRQFAYQIANGARPRVWGHCFGAEFPPGGNIVSRVQFFVGPDYLPPSWGVRIGPNPSLVDPRQGIGHHAYYYKVKTDGHDGRIMEMSLTRAGDLVNRNVYGFAKVGVRFKL
jgi:hypothetical protein